jgi:hypothetical protein
MRTEAIANARSYCNPLSCSRASGIPFRLSRSAVRRQALLYIPLTPCFNPAAPNTARNKYNNHTNMTTKSQVTPMTSTPAWEPRQGGCPPSVFILSFLIPYIIAYLIYIPNTRLLRIALYPVSLLCAHWLLLTINIKPGTCVLYGERGSDESDSRCSNGHAYVGRLCTDRISYCS